jgi:hypothetical protein
MARTGPYVWVASSLAFAVMTVATAAAGEASPDDVALRAGLGSDFGGLGVQLGASWHLGNAVELGPFAGFGMTFAEEQAPVLWAGAGGARASLGQNHRLVLELGYAFVGYADLALHGVSIARDPIYGLIAPIGYEYAAGDGFVVHLMLGPSLSSGLGWQWLGSGSLGLGMRWGS